MKITFVQNEKEMAESDRVIRAGFSLRKAKTGVWILPPASPDDKFTVVDSPNERDVYVESFDTVADAVMRALEFSEPGGAAWRS